MIKVDLLLFVELINVVILFGFVVSEMWFNIGLLVLGYWKFMFLNLILFMILWMDFGWIGFLINILVLIIFMICFVDIVVCGIIVKIIVINIKFIKVCDVYCIIVDILFGLNVEFWLIILLDIVI